MQNNNPVKRVYRSLYRRFGPQRWWPGDTPLEIIVGAILTQNTAWANVEKAIANLKRSGALRSVASMRKLSRRRLATLIRPAGYYNVKAVRLHNCMAFLDSLFFSALQGPGSGRLSDFQSQSESRKCEIVTEALRAGLLSVNGIGPETADSIILYAFGLPVFVVDAYTRRIFSRHGLIRGDENYEAIRSLFESRLPRSRKLFNEYHALIVRLGKEHCRPKPRCDGCPLEVSCRRCNNA